MKKIDKQSLMELANSIIDKDGHIKIATLGGELTISQVIRFFKKQGISFTKTMIQNYVRVGVLPPPVEKRYYTRNHLVALALIDSLKAVYSLEEIRTVLEPIRNKPELFEDDIIKTADIYKNYLEMRKQALSRWKESLPMLFDSTERILIENGVKHDEMGAATAFMITLTIMAETIAMKDLAAGLIREYVASG